ncbi:hypothetical protein V1477_007964 [Vespula maculifrons]|uniref:Uncharacterized protein n=1 Tax=Vespula maculifrons TaxID=7453 RepID=A0ABD2CF64_VESMC
MFVVGSRVCACAKVISLTRATLPPSFREDREEEKPKKQTQRDADDGGQSDGPEPVTTGSPRIRSVQKLCVFFSTSDCRIQEVVVEKKGGLVDNISPWLRPSDKG